MPAIFLTTYMAPCAVNLALACELYFKAIISEEHHGQAPKTHFLKTLFDELQSASKNAIEAEYNSFSPFLSLGNCLVTHNNAFIDWRYYYENSKNGISVHPPCLYYLALSLNHLYSRMEASTHAD